MTRKSRAGSPAWLAERGLLYVTLLVLVALTIFTISRVVLAFYTGTDDSVGVLRRCLGV